MSRAECVFTGGVTFSRSPGWDSGSPDSLHALQSAENGGNPPFSPGDISAGSELEMQVAVIGDRSRVDLPLSIENSNYYANVIRHIASGDTPRRAARNLERYLENNPDNIWENSWVRFPRRLLGRLGNETLNEDLLADRLQPVLGYRSDIDRFLYHEGGEAFVRVPVSYLVKLALIEILDDDLHPALKDCARRILPNFLNDNTSPENFSFHVTFPSPANNNGMELARETSLRFLLTQLLVRYANIRFELIERGQRALIFLSPRPPVRQNQLNECIADSFYRELFMSPCLSGWNKGEDKHKYMQLCHQVLSRSHLNGVIKLREAGIITRNLIVMPNVSNTSLSNNGTHVSLGSNRLTRLLSTPESGFRREDEKYLGDLVIKIAEHFLPLFVGTLSAAPQKLDFRDFHPERLLGFLPHELDYTHLRQIWRRWKKKAANRFLGHSFTPFGPELLDTFLEKFFNLRGDLVPDYRLLDYPVALMSTNRSPALDGRVDNTEALKKDLDNLGIFDRRMSMYLPVKQREYHAMGFSGFEFRQYSQFESLENDFARAVDLQIFVLSYAWRMVCSGRVTHRDIPDAPMIESERRVGFFCAAIGLPTFFIREDTPNHFLARIAGRASRLRESKRYSGYLRLYTREYQLALLNTLAEEAPDLVEAHNMGDLLENLRLRLEPGEKSSAAHRIREGILQHCNRADALNVRSEDYNLAAEKYYRETLNKKQCGESLQILQNSFDSDEPDGRTRELYAAVFPSGNPVDTIDEVKKVVLNNLDDAKGLKKAVHLCLLREELDRLRNSPAKENPS